MKNKTLIIILSIATVVIVGVMAVIAFWPEGNSDNNNTEKNITVTVIYADKTSKKIEISTNAKFLGEAVFEEGLTNEDEYKEGFYTYIDGVRADYNLDKCWWGIYKDGEMQNFGMNEIAISDGDKFEIINTPA